MVVFFENISLLAYQATTRQTLSGIIKQDRKFSDANDGFTADLEAFGDGSFLFDTIDQYL